MTRENAISLLSQVNHILVNSNSWLENTHEPLNIAFDMAIKALEKEPCEDCISREQAIKATYGFERYTGIDEAPYEYTESILRELPPVTSTHIDLDGLKSDMKALNCGYPYGLDYLLDCLKKRLGITIAGAESESE